MQLVKPVNYREIAIIHSHINLIKIVESWRHNIFFISYIVYIIYYISTACPEASRHLYAGLGTQTVCHIPNSRKTGAKQHQIFNHIFNVNVSSHLKFLN